MWALGPTLMWHLKTCTSWTAVATVTTWCTTACTEQTSRPTIGQTPGGWLGEPPNIMAGNTRGTFVAFVVVRNVFALLCTQAPLWSASCFCQYTFVKLLLLPSLLSSEPRLMLWMARHEHCSQAVLPMLTVVRIILRKITIRAKYITALISLPVAALVTVISAS